MGLRYDLQLYGDGAVFSYAVAIRDAWDIHWHNIIGRVAVYIFCILPAEALGGVTDNPDIGIDVYGFLFFSAQAIGLAATFVLDKSRDRTFFTFACASTASLCPLVFGFPTEMWVAHALFWPALTLCHYPRQGAVGLATTFVVLLALTLTHEGAVGFTLAIVATLLLRGPRDLAFQRAAVAAAAALAVWAVLKLEFPPDDYISPVMEKAKLHFFDPHIFTSGVFALLALSLIVLSLLFAAFRLAGISRAAIAASTIVLILLVGYFAFFEHPLHADNRYYLRTVIFLLTPVFGVAAALLVARPQDYARPFRPLAVASEYVQGRYLRNRELAGLAIAAIAVVTFINAAEAARFVVRWQDYSAAIRGLATGTASDPALGDARFVSSAHVRQDLQALAWSSTTPFLSILVAPKFVATRLVVDPTANFFWFTCAAARAQERSGGIPTQPLRILRAYTCRHR